MWLSYCYYYQIEKNLHIEFSRDKKTPIENLTEDVNKTNVCVCRKMNKKLGEISSVVPEFELEIVSDRVDELFATFTCTSIFKNLYEYIFFK